MLYLRFINREQVVGPRKELMARAFLYIEMLKITVKTPPIKIRIRTQGMIKKFSLNFSLALPEFFLPSTIFLFFFCSQILQTDFPSFRCKYVHLIKTISLGCFVSFSLSC